MCVDFSLLNEVSQLRQILLWRSNVSMRLSLGIAIVFCAMISPTIGGETPPPVADVEIVPQNESAQIQSIMRLTIEQMRQRYLGAPAVLRGVHPKDHGCVTAKFKVLDNLPENLRVGVFSKPGREFDAWIRYSNAAVAVGPDSGATSHGSRGMAIKLMGVDGQPLLKNSSPVTQDFLMVNHPVFAFANVEDYAALSRILLEDKDNPARFFAERIKLTPAGAPDFSDAMTRRAAGTGLIFKRIQSLSTTATPPAYQTPPVSPTDNQYFSAAPFLFGPNSVMKYSAKPVSPPSTEVRDVSDPNYLRHALLKQLTGPNAKEIVFEFKLQIRPRSDFVGKVETEIEDACFEWPESKYPFVSVATITIPPQDFDSDERKLQCENLVFTPWHGLTEHQPIGGINRLRLSVYEASSGFRKTPREPAGLNSSGQSVIGVPKGTNHTDGFDEDIFHYADQGSGFFPLEILRALKDSETKKPFLENLERFGLVPGVKSNRNPDGFPIGIVVNTIDIDLPLKKLNVAMLGFTCAACHTSDIRYNNQTVRVDGGSGLFYVDKLGDQIAASMEATLKDPQELIAFLDRFARHAKISAVQIASIQKLVTEIQGNSEIGKALAKHLQDEAKTLLAKLKECEPSDIQKAKAIVEQITAPQAGSIKSLVTGLLNRNLENSIIFKSLPGADRISAVSNAVTDLHEVVEQLKFRLAFLKIRGWLAIPGNRSIGGYGRADDFGTARVELFAAWSPDNMRPVDAPLSIPPLWNIDKFAFLHANANTNSVIQRSIGEAIGVGATFKPNGETSVNIINQMQIEEQLHKLTAPEWPDAFGKPDPAKVARGAIHYKALCAGCHDPKTVNAQGLVEFPLSTLEQAGTDPNDAKNFDVLVTTSNSKKVKFADAIKELLNTVQTKARNDFLISNPEAAAQMDALEARRKPVVWRNTMTDLGGPVYPAKPLDGIWATAPYLHNGSVPSLWALLTPKDRPKKFLVGQKDFDPQNVGFELDKTKIKAEPGLVLFELDTGLSGNHNTGHDGPGHGTELSETEKRDLIEYLKTHKTSWPK
jgi:hypothetical protein